MIAAAVAQTSGCSLQRCSRTHKRQPCCKRRRRFAVHATADGGGPRPEQQRRSAPQGTQLQRFQAFMAMGDAKEAWLCVRQAGKKMH